MYRALLHPRARLALLVGVIVLAAWSLPATPAFAHGGNSVPPVGTPVGPPNGPAVPPLKPPPSTPRPGLPSTPGGPLNPGTGPVTGGVGGVPNPAEAWQTWWNLNRWGLLAGRDEAQLHRVVTPGDGSDDTETALSGWTRRRVLAARTSIVPFLLRLVEPAARERDEVVAAALIALGRVSEDRIVFHLLLHHLKDPEGAPIVRESAALAVGLLRRTDPDIQYRGDDLDDLREELLTVFDDADAPTRTRAFCALSIGLLADQPYGSTIAKDGRLMARGLWQRMSRKYPSQELPVALLVALGLQPPAGVPEATRDALRAIVSGRPVLGRRWDPVERSHALSTALRLGGDASHRLLLRTLSMKRTHVHLRRAAYISIGHVAGGMTPRQRLDTARALVHALDYRRDPFTTSLGHIAAGHLLRADLGTGSTNVLRDGRLSRILFDQAEDGVTIARGFAAVGLAIAAAGRNVPEEAGTFLEGVERIMMNGLLRGRGDDRVVGAYVVGAGIIASRRAVEPLREILLDTGSDPEIRGHAALALGQIGVRSPEVMDALKAALSEQRGIPLRRQSALGLALLGGRLVHTDLLEELRTADTLHHRVQVVLAIGRLGDLTAVPHLVAYASDADRKDVDRAFGVVSLGLLADPEPRPSLLRVAGDANYPAGTDALIEALSIF
ncbi:MAG: HEAT repeat domain-containing protein [Planctomycetota bacterium]